jgi:putative transposase
LIVERSGRAVALAIGITCAGDKEILGLWIEETEGAKFWLKVMNELKTRGTEDLLIAVVDSLKGFPEAITSIFPDCMVQTCIVHLIRYSMQFAKWKERKALAKALRPIYSAASAEASAAEFDAFKQGPWGEKYPAVTASWR